MTRARCAPGSLAARSARAGTALWAVLGLCSAVAQQDAAGAVEGAANGSLAGALVPDLLILVGCVFLLAAAIGLVRFPDFYTRLHATTKLVTLGGIGIFGGAAIAFAEVQATERVLLIAVFFFLTAPLSGYMVARSGYLRGLPPYQEPTSVDEWGALGSSTSDLPETDDAAPAPWGGSEPGRP